MSDTNVGSLYVGIGFELEKGDLRKVERDVERFTEKLEKQAVIRPTVSWKERRAEMQKEAMLWRSAQIAKQRIHERAAIQSQSRISRALTKKRNLGGGFGAGLGLGGIGAGIGMGAILGDELSFNKQLVALDVASRGAMGSIDRVRSQVVDTSNEIGVEKEQILAGASAYVRLTGDGQTATKAMATFGRVAKATGGNIEDVAGTAAAMSQQLGISAGDMEKAFSILIAGGKAGAIEMKDMAQFSAELASQFKTFSGGTGVRGLAQMNAAFQIAAQNFGGKAPETATGLKALFSSFTSPRTLKALKGMGVEIFKIGKDGTATLKSFPEIFDEMAKTDMIRDPRLLTKVFESSEARRAASAILGNVDAFKKLSSEILRAKDATEDFARVSQSRAAQVETAWVRAKNAAAAAANWTLGKTLGFAEDVGTSAGVAADLVSGPKPSATGSPVAQAQWMDQENELDHLIKKGLRAEDIAKMTPVQLAEAMQKVGGPQKTGFGLLDFQNKFRTGGAIEAAKRRVAQDTKQSDQDDRRHGLQLPTGERFRMDKFHQQPELTVDQPFRYEPPAASGGKAAPVINSTVNLTVEAGVDAGEFEQIARKVTREENDRLARDVEAAAGN
jgi:TP901 family phage tail tape measure protein